MFDLAKNLAAGGLTQHLEFLWLLAVVFLGGTIGARILQKLHMPKIVGYVIVGVLVGQSGLGLVSLEAVESLDAFSVFVLGIVGFLIGKELHRDVFKKYGRQLIVILLAEGLGAFLVVFASASFIAWKFSGDVHTSLAMGLLLGAIASATAPAATVNVLWEYKTRGILTTTILAIVALDDALALLLYAFAAGIAGSLTGLTDHSGLTAVAWPLYEILGATALGGAAGLLFSYVLKHVKKQGEVLLFAVGAILIVTAVAVYIKVGSILAAMAFGASVTNLVPRRSKTVFAQVEGFAPPLYVVFFVLAGARTVVHNMSLWVWLLAAAYVLGRTLGKAAGAWTGARFTHAARVVQRYLGLCLLSNAGVAIGLAILASQTFAGDMGRTLLVVVMATTFLLEIVGPACVKVGVRLAGEVGLNVTEEDLIEEYSVRDVMSDEPAVVQPGMTCHEVIETFSESDATCCPMVDKDNKVMGIVTLEGIKAALSAYGCADPLVLAIDIKDEVTDKTTADKPLADVLDHMKEFSIENMPVVAAAGDDRLVGLLDTATVNRRIGAELLRRRQQAEAGATTAT